MEVIDYMPSYNSKFALPFLIVAILGLVLGIVNSLLPDHITSVAASLCEIFTIYFLIDSLRKGLKGYNKVITGLLIAAQVLIIFRLAIQSGIWINSYTGNTFLRITPANIWIFTIIKLLQSIFLVPTIIAFIMIATKFKGAVSKICVLYTIITATLVIVAPSSSIITAIISSERNVPMVSAIVIIFFSIAYGYVYFLAYKAIACKDLIPNENTSNN